VSEGARGDLCEAACASVCRSSHLRQTPLTLFTAAEVGVLRHRLAGYCICLSRRWRLSPISSSQLEQARTYTTHSLLSVTRGTVHSVNSPFFIGGRTSI